MASYKVVRAFERWEGKALRRYLRGSIIPSKDAARIRSLNLLVQAGNVYMVPDHVEQPAQKAIAEVAADASDIR